MATFFSEVERIYAVSDIHGQLEPFRAVVKRIDLAGDSAAQLVLLGDYVDRGPASAHVLTAIKDLQQQFPDRVMALLGNHDDWLLGWLDGDDEDFSWLIADAGHVTVKSCLDPLELAHALGHEEPGSDASALDGPTMISNIKKAVLAKHPKLIAWLLGLAHVYETVEQIFVHAGVDEKAGEERRAATPDHMLTEKHLVGPLSEFRRPTSP